MNRTILTATAFTLLATPSPVLAHSGAHVNPATLAEPLGGWLAVLGLFAAGVLLRETRRDEMIATGTGLALGVLRLVPVAAPILWAGGLAGAALALGSRNPSRSSRCAPIGLLSLAQGAGLASTVSLGVAEAALFVIGTGGVITLGLLFAALREQSDIVGPNSSAHPTTREGTMMRSIGVAVVGCVLLAAGLLDRGWSQGVTGDTRPEPTRAKCKNAGALAGSGDAQDALGTAVLERPVGIAARARTASRS